MKYLSEHPNLKKVYNCKSCSNVITQETAFYGSGLCGSCSMCERFKDPKEHKKLSIAHRGQVSYWRGKKRSEMRGKNNPMYGNGVSGEKNVAKRPEVRRILSLQKIGANNPSWKGGITSLRNAIENLLEYKQWKQDVYRRDNYTCQECGKRGRNLNSHHRKPFAEILQEFVKLYDQFSVVEDKYALVR